MPASSITPNTGALLMQSLEDLREGLRDFRTLFEEHDKLERQRWDTYMMRHNDLDAKANSAHTRIDVLEKDLQKLAAQVETMSKSLPPLILSNKILTYLAVTLSGLLIPSVAVFLWMLITHQIQVLP